jgi:hypothetical protein
MFDFDEGMHRVAKKYRIPYVPASHLRDWNDVLTQIDDEMFKPYDTFIFDTATQLMNYLADYVVKQNIKNGKAGGGLSLQGYGALGEAFRSFVKKLKTMGKHIVFVAHEKEYKEGDATRLRPDIVGSNLGIITKDADLIGYMESVNNESVVQFSPTDRFYAKNSCGLPPQLKTSEMSISAIIEMYEESINNESDELESYRTLIKLIESDLEQVDDVISMNDAFEKMKGYQHVITSKVDAWELFKQKAEQLNLEYDKEQKCFLAINVEEAEEENEEQENTAETPPPVEPAPIEVPTVPKRPKTAKNV